MKKFLATIICFIYITASSGATINFHYCMGKFIGWDIAPVPSAMCSNCGMGKKQKQGCCNDKHATLQLKKDQLISSINFVPNRSIEYIQNLTQSLLDKGDIADLMHSPPLIQAVSTFIFNHAFRI